MKIVTISLLVALTILLLLCACGCVSQDVVISGEERTRVLEYAEPITDNLLQGFNEDNYTMYSRDFSSAMREGLNASSFSQTRTTIISRIGHYLSRGEPRVTGNGEYIAVNYKADFEQEQGVDLRVVFRRGDDSHQVYGLWFNSPKLRS